MRGGVISPAELLGARTCTVSAGPRSGYPGNIIITSHRMLILEPVESEVVLPSFLIKDEDGSRGEKAPARGEICGTHSQRTSAGCGTWRNPGSIRQIVLLWRDTPRMVTTSCLDSNSHGRRRAELACRDQAMPQGSNGRPCGYRGGHRQH